MLSVSIYTLGCKLNQLESESLADAFKGAGFKILPWEPEETPEDASLLQEQPHILVVNSCTVTSKADQKARRIIRRALRNHPWSVLIVTGCYAQLNPQEIKSLETDMEAYSSAEDISFPIDCKSKNRLFVIGGDQKSALLDLPKFLVQECSELLAKTETKPDTMVAQSVAPLLPVLLSQWVQNRGQVPRSDRFRFNPAHFSFHSRASLKIQDGCDNSCSYCRVSLARGPSLSLEAAGVLSALKALEENGYGEAVLTGVNVSQYRDGPRDLAGLLEYLLTGTAHIRLRLSSIEPDGITQRLITILGHPRIRPHFHLSVQSGSSLILEKMGRPYTPEAITEGVSLLRSVKSDPFLACDIITGFPGETEEAFETTYKLCERLDFAWIHAFPYSRRPGTKAYTFKESVSEREARFRVDRLLALGAQGRQKYIRRWLGKTVEAIVEASRELHPPFTAAVADNYLKLLLTIPVDAPSLKPGSALRCQICGIPDGESPFDVTATLASVLSKNEQLIGVRRDQSLHVLY